MLAVTVMPCGLYWGNISATVQSAINMLAPPMRGARLRPRQWQHGPGTYITPMRSVSPFAEPAAPDTMGHTEYQATLEQLRTLVASREDNLRLTEKAYTTALVRKTELEEELRLCDIDIQRFLRAEEYAFAQLVKARIAVDDLLRQIAAEHADTTPIETKDIVVNDPAAKH